MPSGRRRRGHLTASRLSNRVEENDKRDNQDTKYFIRIARKKWMPDKRERMTRRFFHGETPTIGTDHMMRFVPKDMPDLHIVLDRLPDDMPVEIDPGIEIIAVNVADLRKIDVLPPDLLVGIPAQKLPNSAVRVNRIGGRLV
jgi:hypothetical protein